MINLNTVIISIITVLGPLIGAVLGYIGSVKTNAKSNKFALDLEKMRIEEEQREEQARIEYEKTTREKERNRALLEELCALVHGAHSDLTSPFLSKESFTDAQLLKSNRTLERINVIVTLYYRGLIQVLGNLQASHNKLEQMNFELYGLQTSRVPNNDPRAQKLISQINEESQIFGKRAADFLKEVRTLADQLLSRCGDSSLF